jgi:acetaldehyde dehydrogenase/alcohol dehydrogenase
MQFMQSKVSCRANLPFRKNIRRRVVCNSIEKTPSNHARLHETIKKTVEAQKTFATYDQEKVDKIFKAAALAANVARIPLAKLAVEETGMGIIEDKIIKNHFASEFIYNKYKNDKTCGVIEQDDDSGIIKLAEPVGVVAGIIPTTNPTSTTLFKALISLKTRNGLVISPHPRAVKSTIESAKVVLDAAVKAGAPPNIISWIDEPTLELSESLMKNENIKLILATGGPGMVRAAYSSGHPSIGVGSGNTPAVIDNTADIQMAVSSIILSKTFDNGMICASEQSVVVMDDIYDKVKKEFIYRGAYFLNHEEKKKVRAKVLINGRLNPDIVGQSVQKIAELCEINIPKDAKLIIAEVVSIGTLEPLSYEKLSPILAMYKGVGFSDSINKAQSLVQFGGQGHTAVLYTNEIDRKNLTIFENTINTVRLLVNTPAAQGAIGDIFNFHLDPSLTLGCGSWGSSSVSANVSPKHLLNIKTVTQRRENMLWFRVPPKVYFKGGCLEVALREFTNKKRAMIITDKPLFDMGYADKVTSVLDQIGVTHEIFYDVKPDPDLETIYKGLSKINQFNPDVIIALGGGSPMDAAKVMWLMYEHSEVDFQNIAMRFMDIRKRVYDLPELGKKAELVCVPTTSGTGSEVTPFSVVTDEKTGIKYPLADYALTPHMAIVDPRLVLHMPKTLTAYGGIDAITHAIESYVSVLATDYTRGLSLGALKVLFKYLPRAYENGANDYHAREKVHNAATIAGMAFANAFLGICHSMAHKVGSNFHVPHGLANAALISHVIKYNATNAPFKQATFPQYKYPNAVTRYAEIADALRLGGTTEEEKVKLLILAIEQMKVRLNIPLCLKDIIGKEKEDIFKASLETLAEQSFDDQCTPANPRYPLISDFKKLLWDAWVDKIQV